MPKRISVRSSIVRAVSDFRLSDGARSFDIDDHAVIVDVDQMLAA